MSNLTRSQKLAFSFFSIVGLSIVMLYVDSLRMIIYSLSFFFLLIGYLIFLAMDFNKIKSIDVFNPSIFFPVLFLLFVFLSSMGLSTLQKEWPFKLWFGLLIAFFSYLLGIVMQKRKYSDHVSNQYYWDEVRFRKGILVLLFVSTASLIYEYVSLGDVPLFSTNPEMVRFQVNKIGYIHTLSVLFKIIIILSIGFIFHKKSYLEKRSLYLYIGIIIFSIFALATLAQRGELIMPFAVSLILIHYLRKELRFKTLLISGLFFAVLLTGTLFYRNYMAFGPSYITSLQEIGFEGYTYIFAPLYLTIAMNYEILRRLLFTFPDIVNYKFGYYNIILPFYQLLPGKQPTLGELQNQIWNNGFYAELTSSFLGPAYADFGMFGFILLPFVLGYVSQLLYSRLRSNKNILIVIIFSYVIYYGALSLYASPYMSFTYYFYLFLIVIFDRFVRSNEKRE